MTCRCFRGFFFPAGSLVSLAWPVTRPGFGSRAATWLHCACEGVDNLVMASFGRPLQTRKRRTGLACSPGLGFQRAVSTTR